MIFGSFLAFLSVFAIWTERQALNTDDWVDTSGRLLENETIRSTLSDYLVDQLYENVDVSKELEEILPGDTKDLAGPAAGGLRQVAGQGAEKVLETSTAQELWEEANRTAHEQLLAVLENKKEAVETEEGNVKLNLGSLLTNLAEQVGIGESLAEKLPPDAAQIEILKSDQLKTAQDIAVAIKGLALLLSILTFVCFGVAIYLSRDGRWVTVLLSGIGLIAAGFARDRRPPHRRRHRRRPAGHGRKREARGRSGLGDRHLADDQHRHDGDRRRHLLPDRRLARLADQRRPHRPPFPGAGPAPASRLRLHRAGDPRLHLLPHRPDPGPALLPDHPDPRRHGRLRDPRAAQADRGGVPRRDLRRRLRRHPRQSRQRGQGREHLREGRRAGLEAAPAGGAPPRQGSEEAAAEAPTATLPTSEEDARLARLERLGSLRDKGILTEEEFAAEKARLLGGDSPPA